MSDAAKAKQLFEEPAKALERLAQKGRVQREVADLAKARAVSSDLRNAGIQMRGLPESAKRGVLRNLARSTPEAMSALSAAFAELAKPPPKIGSEETDVEQAIVATLGANPAVDAVFLRVEPTGELAAYLSVRERTDELYEFAVDAENGLTESVSRPVVVHVWAHQGRDPLASAPPDVRLVFNRRAV